MTPTNLTGLLRSDGRKGIRNQLLVVYLVECAHHVAREIATPYRDQGAQIIRTTYPVVKGQNTIKAD